MKIKNFIKKNYKIGIGVILGLLISIVGAYASDTTSSLNISYDNSKSDLTSTNMQGAIDELNEKANKPCKVIKGTGTTTSDEIKCGTEEFYVLYTSGDSINVLTKYPIEAGAAAVSIDDSKYEFVEESSIQNPSYTQNKNCGSSNFLCGGDGFPTKYKEVLNKIGLSSDIEVLTPSISDLNKAGCNFATKPTWENNNGDCSALPWLTRVVLTDIMNGPNTNAVASSGSLTNLAQRYYCRLSEYAKLMVKIPIKNILM